MNSGLKTAIEQQTSPVNGGLETSNQENLVGTEITPGTFRALEGKKAKTINRDAYGSFNLLKFHLYENGLIIKEYQLGTSKPIQYEVVNEVKEEFNDGGFREIDGYFEGTKLAFVDYLRPHAIVKKGFKLAFISGAKISKYKGDLSVRKAPTVENKSKGSVNGSKEAGNPNKGTGKSPSDFADRGKLEGHFDKHGKEFDGLYKNADEYLEGAKEVINNGIRVKYEYKGEIRTGYVKFMGNNKNGKAKFEFVGTNNNGDITTYHTQSGKKIWKTINGENIPVINPAD